MALAAGLPLQDMEFVQFYPLCFSEKGFARTVIFAQLAELGRLFNSREEDLKAKYGIEGPDAGMRARDRLSQAIFKEIHKEGRAVWIDLRNVPEDKWRTDPYFSSSREFLRERCGAKHHPLRVAPLAHQVMGGVRIDRSGATTVPGLFAAGEVTGGSTGQKDDPGTEGPER